MKKNKKSVKKDVGASKNKKNQELNDQIVDLENKNLRLLADFENLKKRKNEEVSNLLKYSGEHLIRDLLPIFDDLDRLKSQPDEVDSTIFQNGVELMSEKLYKVLSDYSIQKFDSLGEIFDSSMHDAMMVQESKKKKNLIIEEFEKGYKYNDKIIRHSKVIVSKGK